MFAVLVHTLSSELDDAFDIDDIARNGGANVSRIRAGGSALNKWTAVMTRVVRDQADEQLLNEAIKHSQNRELRELIRLWLAEPWP